MRLLAVLVVVVACGGPTQNQLAETPSAKNRAAPTEPPPASSSDRERAQLVQQFDDMETTQRARQEAKQGAGAGSAGEQRGSGAQPGQPKKKGPAVQGTLPPKKQGPAEQAPAAT